MKYPKLGKSNCTVSAFCLGTMHSETIDQLNEIFEISHSRPLVNNAESPEACAW